MITTVDPAVKTTEPSVEENANLDVAVSVKRGEPHIVVGCCHATLPAVTFDVTDEMRPP